jgi:wyosine [tRNA(Phe)-imidazoG37] synthetase (radical SAM superfamily)
MAQNKYVFGPVPSRRLKKSLGVDVIPSKTCTFDCIYCQVGKTKRTTSRRRSFMPIAAVLKEIRAAVKASQAIDYITFSGSGEPTLNKDLGKMITEAKALDGPQVAVITNSSLLWRDDVRTDLAKADVVLPSLDFGAELTFQKVNRPHRTFSLPQILDGLIWFRKGFKGQVWLEMFFVKGINDSKQELNRMRRYIDMVRPDKVHLNTAVRPPQDTSAIALSREELTAIRKFLGPQAEVIAEYGKAAARHLKHAHPEKILEMLQRRPLTLEDMTAVLGMHSGVLLKTLQLMGEQGKVCIRRHGNKVYYMVK